MTHNSEVAGGQFLHFLHEGDVIRIYKRCSKCGARSFFLNDEEGKRYECEICGHEDWRSEAEPTERDSKGGE